MPVLWRARPPEADRRRERLKRLPWAGPDRAALPDRPTMLLMFLTRIHTQKLRSMVVRDGIGAIGRLRTPVGPA